MFSRTRFFCSLFILASFPFARASAPRSPGPHLAPLAFARACEPSAIWPSGQGSPLVPQAPSADLRAMLAEVSAARMNATVAKLVSFGTRHTLSSQTDSVRGIGAARDWLLGEMRALAGGAAHVDVALESYIQQPAEEIPFAVNISDIVATIQGTEGSARVYVVSGHYDSRVTDILNYTDDAPGADDDGSGVAVVLELLRIFAARPPPAATIVLTAVAGEEQGLYGSTFLAEQMKAAGWDVQGMFTNDIVGSSTADDGSKDPYDVRIFAQGMPTSESAAMMAERESIGGENDSPARELGRFVQEVATNDATEMNGAPSSLVPILRQVLTSLLPTPACRLARAPVAVRMIYRLDRYLRGGDHEPFLAQGWPAARFTEPHENFAHQHQDVRVDPATGEQFGDLIEFCDFDFAARVARVNMAAAWSLASAPGTPKNVTIDTSVLTNNSTLGWAVPEGGAELEALEGYEVLWRPTDAPEWTSVIPVGVVDRVTVQVSKDNVAFGVRAVGKNGYKSPAAFPFPG